jgi:hypothetical protein
MSVAARREELAKQVRRKETNTKSIFCGFEEVIVFPPC